MVTQEILASLVNKSAETFKMADIFIKSNSPSMKFVINNIEIERVGNHAYFANFPIDNYTFKVWGQNINNLQSENYDVLAQSIFNKTGLRTGKIDRTKSEDCMSAIVGDTANPFPEESTQYCIERTTKLVNEVIKHNSLLLTGTTASKYCSDTERCANGTVNYLIKQNPKIADHVFGFVVEEGTQNALLNWGATCPNVPLGGYHLTYWGNANFSSDSHPMTQLSKGGMIECQEGGKQSFYEALVYAYYGLTSCLSGVYGVRHIKFKGDLSASKLIEYLNQNYEQTLSQEKSASQCEQPSNEDIHVRVRDKLIATYGEINHNKDAHDAATKDPIFKKALELLSHPITWQNLKFFKAQKFTQTSLQSDALVEIKQAKM